MVSSGLAGHCQRCDADGGSCCGAGIEDRCDSRLLLVNSLLGAELSRAPVNPQSCHFLGPRGCRLRARETICVNYCCGAAVTATDGRLLAELRVREGIELEALFLLQRRLRQLTG